MGSLTKKIKLIFLCLLTSTFIGCDNSIPNVKKEYVMFVTSLKSNDTSAIKTHLTDNAYALIQKKYKSDTSYKYSQMIMEMIFKSPVYKKANDSVVYILSGHATNNNPISSIEYVRINGQWLLNDYRMGK